MANDVYTKSQSLSAEQKNLALYFRDATEPGYYGDLVITLQYCLRSSANQAYHWTLQPWLLPNQA
jgi:hypothetical protein